MISLGIPTETSTLSLSIRKRIPDAVFDNIQHQSVETLSLRPRLRRIFSKYRITTIGELISNFDQLPSFEGLGHIYITEIINALNLYILKPPDGDIYQPPQRIEPTWVSQIPPNITLDEVNIEELNLSVRTKNAVLRGGVSNLGDLASLGHEIADLQFPNFGLIGAQELSDKLEKWIVNANQGAYPQPAQSSAAIKVHPNKTSPSWVSRVPSHILLDEVSIEELCLSVRTKNAILRGGVFNLGDLAALGHEIENYKFRNFGSVSARELSEKLEQWIAAVAQQSIYQLPESSEIDQSRNVITLQGSKLTETQTACVDEPPILISPVESLIILLSCLKTDQASLIQSLYGLTSGSPMTLQGVADLKGVTRERIRQRKNTAILRLAQFINPQETFPMANLIEHRIKRRHGVISHSRLVTELTPELSPAGFSSQAVLELLCDIGLEKIKPRLVYLAEISAWMTAEADIEQIILAHNIILNRFSQDQAPLAWSELYSMLHRTPDLLALQEEYAFAIALSIADRGLIAHEPDGNWTLPGSMKKGRRYLIIDALRQIGSPAHFTEITRVYNLSRPQKQISEKAVLGILVGDEEAFVRVGRGTYGLAEWGLYTDGNLANAVWRVLDAQQHPMTIEEVIDEVQRTWQVESNSIQAAINTDSRFTRFEDGRIGISNAGTSIKKVKKKEDVTRRERLIDVLLKIGEPCHYKEITRQHNQHYPSLPLTETRVYNALIHLRPKIIHHSAGIFGFAEWGLSEKDVTPSSTTRLIEVLESAYKPLHYKEIHCIHNQLYPETTLSVVTICQSLKKHSEVFSKTGQGTYGLVGWNLTEQYNDPSTAKARLIQILSKAGIPMHYKDVHKAHNRAYPSHMVADSTIYNRLNRNPDTFVNTGDGIFGLVEWGSEKVKSDQTTTVMRLREILLQYNKPMHYTELHVRHNLIYPEWVVSTNTIYHTLKNHTEAFVMTGHGYFCLAEWALLKKQDAS
jgi:DNA-directed RNA polymerase alpha subunit